MESDNQAFLDGIVNSTDIAIRAKFERGQAEHGGRMWRKGGMLAQAEAEAHDNIVYLATLRGQIEQALDALIGDEPLRARGILRAILGPAAEAESDAFPQ